MIFLVVYHNSYDSYYSFLISLLGQRFINFHHTIFDLTSQSLNEEFENNHFWWLFS